MNTCMNAVAMMTPLPKNLAIMKAALGIFNAGTRLERTGKNAPDLLVPFTEWAGYGYQQYWL